MSAPVVDSHVHLLPGRLAAKVRGVFAPIADLLAYPIDNDSVRQQLADQGITEAWTLPYAHKPGVAEWLNEQTRDIAAAPGPLTVVQGATTHPGDPDPALIVRRAVEHLGARVLKLHCSVGDYAADDRRLDAVWAYVEEIRLPVVVHVGHATNGQTDGAELAPIRTVAGRHPGAVVIVAHCALPAVEAALDVLDEHPNVYADLTPVISEAPNIPPSRWATTGDKLLFGSDAPNTAITAGDHLAGVSAQCASDERRAWVTGGLARALIDATIR